MEDVGGTASLRVEFLNDAEQRIEDGRWRMGDGGWRM